MAVSILGRFKDIMAANVHALLDKAEDPEKMIDQYLKNMERDLSSVKIETAAVIAEESKLRRKVAECENEIKKMENYAKKALQAGNEGDARLFLEKKESMKVKLESLKKSSEIASENAEKMRQMYDKLTDDMQKLSGKQSEIKMKMKMAKTSQTIHKRTVISASGESQSAFEAMQAQANRMVDEADAMIELNTSPKDDLEELKRKYDSQNSTGEDSNQVDAELGKMKRELGL